MKLGDLIFNVNKSVIGKKGIHYQKLLKDWSKIIGESLARYAIPVKISSIKRKTASENILYLATNNASSSAELVYHLGVIKEQINVYFGYPYIQQIKLVQAVFQVQPEYAEYTKKLSESQLIKLDSLLEPYEENDEIKAVLKDLANSILVRNIK